MSSGIAVTEYEHCSCLTVVRVKIDYVWMRVQSMRIALYILKRLIVLSKYDCIHVQILVLLAPILLHA
jgi:hypothetical protein